MKTCISLLSLMLYCSNVVAEEKAVSINKEEADTADVPSPVTGGFQLLDSKAEKDTESQPREVESDPQKEIILTTPSLETYSLKGKFYVIWGWNQSYYTDSNIHFKGDDYDFTLYRVDAYDRQSKFNAGLYFGFETLTIPQYNFKLGYYFTDRLSLNLSFDHMKYVMQQKQTTKIKGKIANSGTSYDGDYDEQDFYVAQDFLKFEHTDGLNYLNVELEHTLQTFLPLKEFYWGV